VTVSAPKSAAVLSDHWRDFDATPLANTATAALRAYDPGHDLPALRKRFGSVLAELGSNENPLGASPLALQAAQSALPLAH